MGQRLSISHWFIYDANIKEYFNDLLQDDTALLQENFRKKLSLIRELTAALEAATSGHPVQIV